MAILDQPRVAVGSYTTGAPVFTGEVMVAAANTALLSPSPTAGELITQYGELRSAAETVRGSQDPLAVEAAQQSAGQWLDTDARQLRDPDADSGSIARGRVDALVAHLRWLPGVSSFDLDASVALIDAAYAHQEEVAAGEPIPAAFPALTNPEQDLPLLRYVPEERRPGFLHGLPASIAELAPEATAQTPGFLTRARALGRTVLEKLHLRARTPAAIGSVAVTADAMPASPMPERVSARSAPDREVVTPEGKKLLLVSFYDIGDPEFAGLADEVVVGRRRTYQEHGLLTEEAQLDNMRGPNVEFLVVVDPETGEPVASIRKIHTTGGDLERLPSYHKFVSDGAYTPEGLAELQSHLTRDRRVVEAAGLWKRSDYDTDIKTELYKAAIQDSVARDELWIIGVVQAEYAGLIRAFGPEVVRSLGNPIKIAGEGASAGVRLRPAMVETRTFFEDLLNQSAAARNAGDKKRSLTLEITMADFLIGLNDMLLSAATWSRIRRAAHVYA
ncbi:MAG TPA: hypothetical protein VLF71_00665 [Candidatus Saccharimonadales bacterium]|nr:hypothetical protein [Candidatus Saccharimonadales bacterium]